MADPPQRPGGGVRLLATRAWHRVRRPLTTRRAPYMLLNRRRSSRRSLVVRPDSVLVIEAPMRSGNTYAVAAFWHANGRQGHVGRHLHAPAHVLQALRLGVPTIVPLRDPRDACVSHVIRRPALTVRDSLIDYVRFYLALEPVADRVTVAPFPVIISDFGSVIERLNRRAGTAFVPYVANDANDAAVIEVTEELNRAEAASDGRVDEMRVARPSAEREQLRRSLAEQLQAPQNSRWLRLAVAEYEKWGSR